MDFLSIIDSQTVPSYWMKNAHYTHQIISYTNKSFYLWCHKKINAQRDIFHKFMFAERF